MRTLLMASVLLATLLAGCSGGGGLASHVVSTGDLDDGFTYWKIPPEAREEGLDRNPGPFDTSDFGDVGVVSGYLSAFSYNGGDDPVIVSQAMRFRNETALNTFFADFGGCSQDSHVIQAGAVITMVQVLAFFAEDGDEEFLRTQTQNAADAIELRVGGVNLCT